MSELRILHVYADKGAENPALDRYGKVYRIGHKAENNPWSIAIKADAGYLPLKPGIVFDIAWFHPPCGGKSPMSDTGDGNRKDWPDLVPQAREIATEYADHYVIENKPRESLDTEVTLTGHMWDLGIEYKRAFETSFPVEQPRQPQKLTDTSPFYYTEKPHGWWASVKGSSVEFSKEHLAKNTIPAVYIDYIMRHYYEYVDTNDLPDYSDYDKKMKTKRSKEQNSTLSEYSQTP